MFVWVIREGFVPTAQRTWSLTIVKTNLLVLFRDVIGICCESQTEHINNTVWQNVKEFLNAAVCTLYTLALDFKRLP
jgi:hypothetical protein